MLDTESEKLNEACGSNIGHAVPSEYIILRTNLINFLNCFTGFAFANNVANFFDEICNSFVAKMSETLNKMNLTFNMYKQANP